MRDGKHSTGVSWHACCAMPICSKTKVRSNRDTKKKLHIANERHTLRALSVAQVKRVASNSFLSKPASRSCCTV